MEFMNVFKNATCLFDCRFIDKVRWVHADLVDDI